MRKYILELSLAVLLYLVMFSCFSTESWMTLWTELGNPLQSLLQVVNAQSWTYLGPLVGWLGSLFDYLKQLSSQTWLGFLTLLATVVIAIFTKKLADFTKLLAKETRLTREIQRKQLEIQGEQLQLAKNQKQLEEKQERQERDIAFLEIPLDHRPQRLLDELSELKKSFDTAQNSTEEMVEWNGRIDDFARRTQSSKIFPDDISDLIGQLSFLAGQFQIRDRTLQAIRNDSYLRFSLDKDEILHRKEKCAKLCSDTDKKLQEVEDAIKKHIQAPIDSKKQTPEGTN